MNKGYKPKIFNSQLFF